MNPLPYKPQDRDDKKPKPTGKTVIYCKTCSAPVVDSLDGIQAHRDRLGHWVAR